MLRNKYTDISVQKGEIPGFSSYVEHTDPNPNPNPNTKLESITKTWADAYAYGTTN